MIASPFRRIAAPVLVLTVLGACSSVDDSRFPSLAKRPIESAGLTRAPDPVEPPPPIPADASIAAQIGALQAQAQGGQGQFAREIGAAHARVAAASGSAPASDAWMEAQMAISGADAARAASVDALASLDQLLVGQQKVGSRVGLQEIEAAISAVRAIVTGQNEALGALKASLRAV